MRDYIIGNKNPVGLAADVARGIIESTTKRTQAKEHVYQTKEYEIDQTITDDIQNGISNFGTSALGTPVYSQITFGLHAGENSNDVNTYIGQNGETYVLPVITFQTILISCVFPRNIVKTEIQGRDGTVKEYIGEGDAQISFRGVITGLNGHYPKDEVQNLAQLVKAPVSVPIVSDYLNNLGVYNVVFDERSFEQEEGGYSYQGFSVNAMSDYPVELHIT